MTKVLDVFWMQKAQKLKERIDKLSELNPDISEHTQQILGEVQNLIDEMMFFDIKIVVG